MEDTDTKCTQDDFHISAYMHIIAKHCEQFLKRNINCGGQSSWVPIKIKFENIIKELCYVINEIKVPFKSV